MSWQKRGRLIDPAGQAAWVGTHAALPTVLETDQGTRVYFCSRDRHNRSHIGYATLDLDSAAPLPSFSPAAVLSPGALGTFDDAGVTTSCLVEQAGRLWLFYTGWTRGVSVPFYLSSGLAVSDDGGTRFRRWSAAPLLDRSSIDPYLTASPWVLVEDGRWRMWYVSGTSWDAGTDGPRHRYHIKYAESDDGVHWRRDGLVCLDYREPAEHAFGRPCVIRDGGLYRMWFSVRGERYRMGYAESTDGVTWTRQDEAPVVEPSPDGWDSEMIAYPVVFGASGRRRLLYNGNGFGRSGIGLAVETA